jgi:hypothetical protein
MKNKKGNLLGRFVNRHIRKWPLRPYEYLTVRAYQEKTEPIPSPLEPVPPQGELDLLTPSNSEEEFAAETKPGPGPK